MIYNGNLVTAHKHKNVQIQSKTIFHLSSKTKMNGILIANFWVKNKRCVTTLGWINVYFLFVICFYIFDKPKIRYSLKS